MSPNPHTHKPGLVLGDDTPINVRTCIFPNLHVHTLSDLWIQVGCLGISRRVLGGDPIRVGLGLTWTQERADYTMFGQACGLRLRRRQDGYGNFLVQWTMHKQGRRIELMRVRNV